MFSIMKQKVTYSLIIGITVFCGIYARIKTVWFPDCVNLVLGDILYAFMVYFLVAFLFMNRSLAFRFKMAILFCYLIEISQLYQSEWINALRVTVLGKLVLGSGFLWTDLLAYAIGAGVAFLVDKFCIRHRLLRTENSH